MSITKLLRLVAEGEQDKAEEMIKAQPALLLQCGEVTDLSDRTFPDITAFQYAVWALDWHMWTMLLKYLPKEEAAKQATQFETGAWVKINGATANWQNLITAQQQYYFNYSKWTQEQRKQNFIQPIGSAQLKVPVHVVNEYCRNDRSFHPTPIFLEPTLPRTRQTDKGEWFAVLYDDKRLEVKCSIWRGGRPNIPEALDTPNKIEGVDTNAARELLAVRTKQRTGLIYMLRRVRVSATQNTPAPKPHSSVNLAYGTFDANTTIPEAKQTQQLQEENQQLSQQCKDLNDRLQDLKVEHRVVLNQQEETQEQIEQYKCLLEDAEGTAKRLSEDAKKRAKLQTLELDAERDKHAQEKIELTVQLKQITHELGVLQSQQQESMRAEEYAQQIQQKDAEFAALRATLATERAHTQRREEELEIAQAQLKARLPRVRPPQPGEEERAQYAQREAKLTAQLEKAKEAYAQEIQSAHVNIKILTESLAQIEKLKETKTIELGQLQQLLKQTTEYSVQEVAHLKFREQNLIKEIEKLEQQCSSLKTDLEKSKTEVKNAIEKNQDLEQNLTQQRVAVQKAQEEVSKREFEYKTKIEQAEKAEKDLEKAKARAEGEVQLLNAQLRIFELHGLPPKERAFQNHLRDTKRLMQRSTHVPPTCYISYAWEDNETDEGKKANLAMRAYLLRLEGDLKELGITVFLDVTSMTGNISDRMAENIAKSHYFLLIGTERLKLRAQDVSTNVGKEWVAIEQRIQQNSSVVIPLLYQGKFETAFPPKIDKNLIRDCTQDDYHIVMAQMQPMGLIRALFGIYLDGPNQQLELDYQRIWNKLEADFKIIELETLRMNQHAHPANDYAAQAPTFSVDIDLASGPVHEKDSFFDALAKTITARKRMHALTAKSLRMLCHQYAQNKNIDWFKSTMQGAIVDYTTQIQFTSTEANINNLPAALPGMPEREGRIICEQYKLQIHVEEENEAGNIIHKLVNADGCKVIDQIDYLDETIVHIRTEGSSAHFIPVLKKDFVLTSQIRQEAKQIHIALGSPSPPPPPPPPASMASKMHSSLQTAIKAFTPDKLKKVCENIEPIVQLQRTGMGSQKGKHAPYTICFDKHMLDMLASRRQAVIGNDSGDDNSNFDEDNNNVLRKK